jgi:oligopeptidase B
MIDQELHSGAVLAIQEGTFSMSTVQKLAILVGLLSGSSGPAVAQVSVDIKPPLAKIIPHATVLYGDERVDNYYWLRERSNPDVLEYLEAENAYTDAVMKPTVAFQDSLYHEMLARIKETDEDPPYPQGDYFYYSRTEKGKPYPIFCRKKGSIAAPEEAYLDQNELSKGHGFYRLWARDISPDDTFLAFSVDTSGSENYVAHIKNLQDGSMLRDAIEHTQSIVWAADNRTLFYTVEDSANRPYRVYRHSIGTSVADDRLIYQEDDPTFTVGIRRSRDNRYVFIVSSASNADEWRSIPAGKPSEAPTLIVPRRAGHEYDIEPWGKFFYIRTNKDAKTFRVVRTLAAQPAETNWNEVLPFRHGTTVEGLEGFADHLVVYERTNGLQQMRIVNLRSGDMHTIEFPEPVYSAFGNVNMVFDTKVFRYSYQSLTQPPSIIDYDMDRRTGTIVKVQEVLGGYDPAQYVSERIFAKAGDGTEVPISLVYRKGLRDRGPAPLHMSGYGAYGASSSPAFSSTRLSYLNRGIIVAIAHVRGGGDMGREWYDDGKLLHKKNTFTDFIACAEHLIAQGYTTKERLTISGGSAGGLLMGAVTIMRPDLFKAVVAQVPFVDALNTMLDPSLMYTTQEYLEWGNPNEKPYYDYMRSYDPYTNTAAQDYPNILVKVGLNDPRVNYWEGAKWVAKLRAVNTNNTTVLLKVNMGAGHAGSSGRYDRLREFAFDCAYVLGQYGIAH